VIMAARSCKNNCGHMVYRSSQSKCQKCQEHKFWFIDIDEYNLNEDDPRKKLKKCECGKYYVLWNQYQHNQSNHHKSYIMKRDNMEITIEKTARLCTVKDENNRIHGRWSINLHDACPKCDSSTSPRIINIHQNQKIDMHISHKYADIYISSSQKRDRHQDIETNGSIPENQN